MHCAVSVRPLPQNSCGPVLTLIAQKLLFRTLWQRFVGGTAQKALSEPCQVVRLRTRQSIHSPQPPTAAHMGTEAHASLPPSSVMHHTIVVCHLPAHLAPHIILPKRVQRVGVQEVGAPHLQQRNHHTTGSEPQRSHNDAAHWQGSYHRLGST